MTDEPDDQVELIVVFGETPEGEQDTAEGGLRSAMFYVYSVGMEKFERSDLMVRDVPQWLLVPALRLLLQICERARDADFKPGETIGAPHDPAPPLERYLMRLTLAPGNWSNNPLGTLELVPVLIEICDHDHAKE